MFGNFASAKRIISGIIAGVLGLTGALVAMQPAVAGTASSVGVEVTSGVVTTDVSPTSYSGATSPLLSSCTAQANPCGIEAASIDVSNVLKLTVVWNSNNNVLTYDSSEAPTLGVPSTVSNVTTQALSWVVDDEDVVMFGIQSTTGNKSTTRYYFQINLIDPNSVTVKASRLGSTTTLDASTDVDPALPAPPAVADFYINSLEYTKSIDIRVTSKFPNTRITIDASSDISNLLYRTTDVASPGWVGPFTIESSYKGGSPTSKTLYIYVQSKTSGPLTPSLTLATLPDPSVSRDASEADKSGLWSYDITVPYSRTKVQLSATWDSTQGFKVYWSSSDTNVAGKRLLTADLSYDLTLDTPVDTATITRGYFIVVAEDSSYKTVYAFNVKRNLPSSTANLDSLGLSIDGTDRSTTPAFTSQKGTFTFLLPYSGTTSKLSLTPVLSSDSDGAAVLVNNRTIDAGQSFTQDLATGAVQMYRVKVKAESRRTTDEKDHNLFVYKEIDRDPSLSALTFTKISSSNTPSATVITPRYGTYDLTDYSTGFFKGFRSYDLASLNTGEKFRFTANWNYSGNLERVWVTYDLLLSDGSVSSSAGLGTSTNNASSFTSATLDLPSDQSVLRVRVATKYNGQSTIRSATYDVYLKRQIVLSLTSVDFYDSTSTSASSLRARFASVTAGQTLTADVSADKTDIYLRPTVAPNSLTAIAVMSGDITIDSMDAPTEGKYLRVPLSNGEVRDLTLKLTHPNAVTVTYPLNLYRQNFASITSIRAYRDLTVTTDLLLNASVADFVNYSADINVDAFDNTIDVVLAWPTGTRTISYSTDAGRGAGTASQSGTVLSIDNIQLKLAQGSTTTIRITVDGVDANTRVQTQSVYVLRVFKRQQATLTNLRVYSLDAPATTTILNQSNPTSGATYSASNVPATQERVWLSATGSIDVPGATTIDVYINSALVASGLANGVDRIPVTLGAAGTTTSILVKATRTGLNDSSYTINITRGAYASANSISAFAGSSGGTALFTQATPVPTTVYPFVVSASQSSIWVTATWSGRGGSKSFTVSRSGFTSAPITTSGTRVEVMLDASAITRISITFSDGTNTPATYYLDVTRPGVGGSTDTSLQSLTSSVGTFTPSFASATRSYTLDVPFATGSVSLTGSWTAEKLAVYITASDASGSTILTNRSFGTSPATQIISGLTVGTNLVTIDVTAEDGTTKGSYTVRMVRPAVQLETDTTLLNLAVSQGSLSFVSATRNYTVNVANTVTSLDITATFGVKQSATIAASFGATTLFAARTLTSDLAKSVDLAVGTTTVTIVVTAESGATGTYTLSIVRASAGGNTDPGNPGTGGTGGGTTPSNLDPVETQVPTGKSRTFEDGVETQSDLSSDVKGGDFGGKGNGYNWSFNGTTPLPNSGTPVLQQGAQYQFKYEGNQPGSEMKVYLFSAPTLLATFKADSLGRVSGTVSVPASYALGAHRLQINSISLTGKVRSVTVGVLVKKPTRTINERAYFAAGSNTVPSSFAARATRLVMLAKGSDQVVITVRGYALGIGNAAAEKASSVARAKALAAYLKRAGLVGNYKVVGMGKALQTNSKARRATVTVSYVPNS